jgi:hypothetical protein
LNPGTTLDYSNSSDGNGYYLIYRNFNQNNRRKMMKKIKSVVVEVMFEDGSSMAHRRFDNINVVEMFNECLRLGNRGITKETSYDMPCFYCKDYLSNINSCKSTIFSPRTCVSLMEWKCKVCKQDKSICSSCNCKY